MEGVENVGQGVVSGEGGRAARGSLDGDIGNAVKGRLGIYWRHAETMRYHFAGIWLQIPRSALIIVATSIFLFVLRHQQCRPCRFPRATQSHVACELWRNLPIPHSQEPISHGSHTQEATCVDHHKRQIRHKGCKVSKSCAKFPCRRKRRTASGPTQRGRTTRRTRPCQSEQCKFDRVEECMRRFPETRESLLAVVAICA